MGRELPERRPIAREVLAVPTSEQMLNAVLALGRDLLLEMEEQKIASRFLDELSQLFPGRYLLVRVLDLRSGNTPVAHGLGGDLRPNIEGERISFRKSSVEKSRLKTALAESARIKFSDRWDSPFVGTAAGFAVPLVAAGELYGVLDVGYPLGSDGAAEDEPLVLPLANYLSVALRNERLHRETTLLRDYQTRLIEHANALIMGIDSNWRITLCNRALCSLTGFSRDELIGKDLRDWLPAEHRPRLTNLLGRAFGQDGQSRTLDDTVDVDLVTASAGTVGTVWSVATIMGRGEIQEVVAIGQDLTKLRELQSQVIQAEKLATLGQLAAGVVHELNNPLTSISIYSEYLLKKAIAGSDDAPEEPEDVVKLRRIFEGAQRIQSFAKELVQYAKPAKDEMNEIAVNQVVRQALSFCEHLFERSGVTLRDELAPNVPHVYAISGQLEQVIINLVTNAVHACGNGGEVRVETTASADLSEVSISVSDNGPGVAETDRDRIFEPFYTTKTGGQGTGLGLSIARNIVQDHSGTLRVTASDSGGARFVCRLPAHARGSGNPDS